MVVPVRVAYKAAVAAVEQLAKFRRKRAVMQTGVLDLHAGRQACIPVRAAFKQVAEWQYIFTLPWIPQVAWKNTPCICVGNVNL